MRNVKSIWMQICEKNRVPFESAIEAAFQSIQWRDSPPDTIYQCNGNSVAFKISSVYSILAIIGIVEDKVSQLFQDKNIPVYYWQFSTCLVITKTKRIERMSQWTRKQKQAILNHTHGFALSCGEGEFSYGFKDNLLIGRLGMTEDELQIVNTIREHPERLLSSHAIPILTEDEVAKAIGQNDLLDTGVQDAKTESETRPDGNVLREVQGVVHDNA